MKKKNKLVVCIGEMCKVSIRQMPQNYLIAYRVDQRWVCDPDLAADKNLYMQVFKRVTSYHYYRYGTGAALIEGIK